MIKIIVRICVGSKKCLLLLGASLTEMPLQRCRTDPTTMNSIGTVT